MGNQGKSIDYPALAELRYQIRRFLRFSEEAARAAGLEPQQHQLLLAIKGLPEDRMPTIGTLAERLQLQHHSAVELVDRSVQRGLVRRLRGTSDQRQVFIRLTAKGERTLRDLSVHHRNILREAGPLLAEVLNTLAIGPRRPERVRRTAS
ncbi:MAG TPA: MarR family transcriptional regulator [Terriglobales bacterium]|nr:MarR family transcriptional regulator [Terriglobales bacterium]